jgi:hypothetical protein
MFASERLVRLGLLVAGIINLLPVSGVLGRSWLQSLYGFEVRSTDLEILLRHRAVFFGLLGLLLLLSVFRAGLRPAAIMMGSVSMAAFLVIALLVGSWGHAIQTVMIVDIVGLLGLLPAMLMLWCADRPVDHGA